MLYVNLIDKIEIDRNNNHKRKKEKSMRTQCFNEKNHMSKPNRYKSNIIYQFLQKKVEERCSNYYLQTINLYFQLYIVFLIILYPILFLQTPTPPPHNYLFFFDFPFLILLLAFSSEKSLNCKKRGIILNVATCYLQIVVLTNFESASVQALFLNIIIIFNNILTIPRFLPRVFISLINIAILNIYLQFLDGKLRKASLHLFELELLILPSFLLLLFMMERTFKIFWIKLDFYRRADKSMEMLIENIDTPIFLLNSEFKLLLSNRCGSSLISEFDQEEFILDQNSEFPLYIYFSDEERNFFRDMVEKTLQDRSGRSYVFTVYGGMNFCKDSGSEEFVLRKVINESTVNLFRNKVENDKKILIKTSYVYKQ